MNHDRIAALKVEWGRLCATYLPISPEGSVWRYSRPRAIRDLDQGWKVHLPATVLTASRVLAVAGTILQDRDVLFKAPLSLDELMKINSGLCYGYAQVGKFITVYPRSKVEFRSLASELHRQIPASFGGPAVPFDFRLKSDSSVFYRYGSFSTRTLTSPDGSEVPAILEPDGTLTPDLRGVPAQTPHWEKEPFRRKNSELKHPPDSPLGKRYHIFRALAQRGKGGVYQAFDAATIPPRLCIIKEGRRHGETAWNGRDGRSLVENEERVLSRLGGGGVGVPQVYDSFELDGNFYLVLEHVAGGNLQKMIASRKRRLPLSKATAIGRRIAGLLAEIHSAGFVWRDCKPANIFVMADESVRPVDFEGACRIDQPAPPPWSTPLFAPPEVFHVNRSTTPRSSVAEDLFALGVCLYYLIEGRLPLSGSNLLVKDDEHPLNDDECATNISNRQANNGRCHADNCSRHADDRESFPVKFARRGVPERINRIISQLLSTDPSQRPSADAVAKLLGSVQSHLPQKLGKPNVVADGVEQRLDF